VAHIDDRSCITEKCHPKDEKFLEKKTEIGEKKILFSHKSHLDIDPKKAIEGQELHCDSCHMHVSDAKHFEVPKKLCYICHFRKTEFAEGRAKCELCHKIPEKPLQAQKKEGEESDERIITHQTLAKTNVPCVSCHYQLVRGESELKKEACLNCHDVQANLDQLQAKNARQIMHQKHVAGQAAKCFNCHGDILHSEKDVEVDDLVRADCDSCHPDHHIFAKKLLVGAAIGKVDEVPAMMRRVKTNCLGCHMEEKIVKGEKVAQGGVKSCVDCHTKEHEKMLKEWIDKPRETLAEAKEIEKESLKALKNAIKRKVSGEKLQEAQAMVEQAQEYVMIVEYGGGVHNKKYSQLLLNAAMDNFEDAADLVSE
jgi:ElaB/YqjD/DUF883 family membrane-anchored ribosome-binding protein